MMVTEQQHHALRWLGPALPVGVTDQTNHPGALTHHGCGTPRSRLPQDRQELHLGPEPFKDLGKRGGS